MAESRRLPGRRALRLAAAGLALALAAGCASSGADGASSTDGGYHGAVLDQQYVVPETPLVDTDGEPFSLADDTDEPLTLVFFGYTNCPDICQAVLASLASAKTRLDEADRERVEVVFVTTDPARDDEAAVRDYLDRFDPEFIGLTGDLDTIIEVGRPLAVAVEKGERLPSGGYEVTHGTQVTAVTSDDRVPLVWTQGTSSAQFAEDIHRLLQDGA
ncbi:SCO family protein [Nocardioides sp. GCM10027113]|uniref:SCO family protein n=1 Tax=unclassified Nocardioides TaxID=2615069 RepID=UPI00360FA030